MIRPQHTQPGGHDAPRPRNALSFPTSSLYVFTLRRMCPFAIISFASGILTWTATPIIGAVVAIILGSNAPFTAR